MCKKEGLGVLGRLVRKGDTVEGKEGLRVCALLGRDRALASFSPVTVLSLAFEILSNHVYGVHLMMHRWGVCLVCLAEPQEDRKDCCGDTGSPSLGSGKIERRLGR